jgi:PadR family transcriptional regulator PadR
MFETYIDMHDLPFPHHPHHGRGWSPGGPRRRWLEPFVLLLLAGGPAHGYSLLAQLNDLGVAADDVDVGQVYRTLRELEMAGLVRSGWQTPEAGPARREYVISPEGLAVLDGWAEVMAERARLVGDFLSRYERLGRRPHQEGVSGDLAKEV